MRKTIIERLGIRKGEKGVFFSFVLFNMILYAGVFLGRAIRDALFFSKIGSQYLPYIFIANAVTMTLFGPYFAKWTGGGYFLRKVASNLFFACAVIIIGFAFLFTFDLNRPLLGFSLENMTIGVFYWITEIPIFLLLNMIWIISSEFISESMGQRLNPKIIGGGHIGIVIGGTIAVFIPSLFQIKMQSLSYIWGALVLLAILMVTVIYKPRVCKHLPYEDWGEDYEEPSEYDEDAPGFFKEIAESFKVIRKYKFTVAFALVALFNFFLFGINDYMLNSRAIGAGMTEEALVSILGYFTIGFGILSAVFQFSFTTRLIKKFGIAKANLGGGIIFVTGAVILLLTSTNMFEPFQRLIFNVFGIKPEFLFLYSIAIVRFGGYIAEYLFNQSMLPSLYGAIPEQDREATRTFIEGTFVQMTFGMTGIFLILYELVFAGNLDFLIILGAGSAFGMFISSKAMAKHYPEMIKLSKSGESFIIKRYVGEINREKVKQMFAKNRSVITEALISIIAGEKRAEFIKDIYGQFDKNKGRVNKAVIKGIIEFNNIEYFDKLLEHYIDFSQEPKKFIEFKRTDIEQVRALLSGFYKMHHDYDVLTIFDGIENNSRCADSLKQEVIYMFSRLENKSGIIKAGKILENMEDKFLAMRISYEMGIDTFAEELKKQIEQSIEAVQKDTGQEEEFTKITDLLLLAEKISYSNQKTLFKMFELVLKTFDFIEIRKTSVSVAKAMTAKNYFLAFIAIGRLRKHPNLSVQKELPVLLADLPVIDKKELVYFAKSYPDFSVSEETVPSIKNKLSINKFLESLIINGQPAMSLNSSVSLFNRMKNKIEKEIDDIIEDEEQENKINSSLLFETQLKKLYLMWAIFAEARDPIIKTFISTRIDLHKKILIYLFYLFDEADAVIGNPLFAPERSYRNISSNNKLLKDNAVTLFEQILPRDVFEKVDVYFFIDYFLEDEETKQTNASSEIDIIKEELKNKAVELYGQEAVKADNICKFINDESFNRLLKTQ